MPEQSKEENIKSEKIEIQSDPEILKGAFSNLTNIGHSKEEFILDFLFVQHKPIPFGKIISRVILTPPHMKRILAALKENIQKYESSFGVINIDPDLQKNKTLQ